MVQVIEGERASAKGHKLFAVTVLPDAGQTPVAVLCWHHGVGEHIGRYEKSGFGCCCRAARRGQQAIAVTAGLWRARACSSAWGGGARLPNILRPLQVSGAAGASLRRRSHLHARRPRPTRPQSLRAWRRLASPSTAATLWGTARARGTAPTLSRTSTRWARRLAQSARDAQHAGLPA